ncbi:MAG: hypothetical protein KDE51_07975, partial [Anaerolineales bacterium]|nr:hypothetical protein [Anaerolineales bacterium]
MSELQRRLSNASAVRVLYLGMFGQLSLIPLQLLLEAGVDVCGVVVPVMTTAADHTPLTELRPPPVVSELPLLNRYVEQTVVQLAWAHNIPVYEVSRFTAAETLATLAALRPTVGCVSCFSKRLPTRFLALVPDGFLNMHPSLLPAYRGPAPLFWVLREGQRRNGVTVHMMEAQLDHGDIVGQNSFALADGLSSEELEQQHATAGGRLLVQAIEQLKHGRLQGRPQGEGGTYYSWPRGADFQLERQWSARRVFNFMRGTAEW